jgi:hypothetical protein
MAKKGIKKGKKSIKRRDELTEAELKGASGGTAQQAAYLKRLASEQTTLAADKSQFVTDVQGLDAAKKSGASQGVLQQDALKIMGDITSINNAENIVKNDGG